MERSATSTCNCVSFVWRLTEQAPGGWLPVEQKLHEEIKKTQRTYCGRQKKIRPAAKRTAHSDRQTTPARLQKWERHPKYRVELTGGNAVQSSRVHPSNNGSTPTHLIPTNNRRGREGGLPTHGGGGAPPPPPVAACVAFSLLCISSHSFFCSFSRLKVFPRRAFSASAASFSLYGGREKAKRYGTSPLRKAAAKQTSTSLERGNIRKNQPQKCNTIAPTREEEGEGGVCAEGP